MSYVIETEQAEKIVAVIEEPSCAGSSGISNIRGFAYSSINGISLDRVVSVTFDRGTKQASKSDLACCSSRGDVQDADPVAPQRSGFSGIFNWCLLTPGKHTISAEFESPSGQTLTLTRDFVSHCEHPSDEFVEAGTFDWVNGADACVATLCEDAKKSGQETGIDCGGDCPACVAPVINEVDYDQVDADTLEFVELYAVAQLLPGPNVVNLSLMIGDRYFGLRGALAAISGMLLAAVMMSFGTEATAAGAAPLARFIDPRHLYRFEHFFAAARVVIVEAVQFHHPVMQVGETHGQRVDVRMRVVQRFGDRVNIGPFHVSDCLR